MLNKKTASLVFVFLVLGCIQQQPAQETKLQITQGVGILMFGLPSSPSSPVIEVQKIPPDSRAFLSLILRNNAEGEIAENVVVSLDNVEPFMMVECNEIQNPTEKRGSENCYATIYDNTGNDPFRSHRMNQMRPDEELEFFWVLHSPSKNITGNMYYEHTVYATISYHYRTSIYTGIAAMSFQEYTSRKANQEPMTGTSTSSAGEIRVRSTTTEPILYSQGSPGSFILRLVINNQGRGIPDPYKNITLTVEFDKNLVQLNGDTSMRFASGDDITWFNQEYGANKAMEGEPLLIQDIEPINLLTGTYTVNIPFRMLEDTSNYQILPFYIRISYDYMLETQTNVGVIPT